jgi:hypothetical protein
MSRRLQLSLPERLRARIQEAAQREHISEGEWIRRAIAHALPASPAVSDALVELARLDAPTGDIDQMLAEIDAGRSGILPLP